MAIKAQNITPFDSDAQRFILAAGLTRTFDKRAINYLVQGFKANNFWARCAAIYPLVGGNLWSAKFNLKNPRDSVLAYALSFVANPSISYMGVDWNGTTQYANTNLNPSTSGTLLLNSTHISYYSRENTSGSLSDMGNTVTPDFLLLGISNVYSVNSAGAIAFTNADTRGHFIITRTSSTLTTQYKNGVSVSSNAINPSTVLPNNNIFIGARSLNGAASNFTNRQCAFASIGSGLTAAEALVFYQIVQQFQIILQRQV